MEHNKSQGILFDMLRSFTTLARTLNLSQAVRELGSTRQTVRRHIKLLEEARGSRLFEVSDRQYCLTDDGQRALQEAVDILSRGEAWLNNQSGHVEGLFHITYKGEEDDRGNYFYYLQQHPLSRVWTAGSEVIRATVKSWAEAGGALEHSAFQQVRPFALMFRAHESDWLCTEVGKKSAYSQWFGWAWARSTVGRPVGGLPGGAGFASLLSQPFDEIRATHGLRYDHVYTQIVHGDRGQYQTVGFERLMAGFRYPDDSLVLVSVVSRTDALDIAGVTPEQISRSHRQFDSIN